MGMWWQLTVALCFPGDKRVRQPVLGCLLVLNSLSAGLLSSHFLTQFTHLFFPLEALLDEGRFFLWMLRAPCYNRAPETDPPPEPPYLDPEPLSISPPPHPTPPLHGLDHGSHACLVMRLSSWWTVLITTGSLGPLIRGTGAGNTDSENGQEGKGKDISYRILGWGGLLASKEVDGLKFQVSIHIQMGDHL